MDGAVNSAISLSEAPEEENGRPFMNSQQELSPYGHGHGNSYILRRKGSFKTRNESSATIDKFAIKPINISSVKQQAEQPEEVDDGSSNNENQEISDPVGSGG